MPRNIWQHLTLLLVFVLQACGQSDTSQYRSRELGLMLEYPAYWQPVGAEQVAAGIAASATQMDATAETLAQAQVVTSGLQLSVVRPGDEKGSPGGASLNIVAIDVPAGEWPTIDLEAIVSGQMRGVAALPGTTAERVKASRLPSGMDGYLAALPTRQGTLYQYQLSYWQEPFYVQLILSSLTEKDRELRNIIASLRRTAPESSE